MGTAGPEGETTRARVLLLSQRNIDRHVWHCSQYEFEHVICAVDDVDLLAPVGLPGVSMTARGRRALVNAGRRRLRQGQLTAIVPSRVDADYDLFFGVFHFAFELDQLQRIEGWRARSQRAFAFIVELWSPWLVPSAHHLQVLRQFDYVFVFNRQVMVELQRLVDVPVSYLPTATDTLLYSPEPPAPARVLDVLSFVVAPRTPMPRCWT